MNAASILISGCLFHGERSVRACQHDPSCEIELSKDTVHVRVERRTGRSNLSESRSRSVAIIIFAITTITYIRTDLRGPRGERGTSAEAARLSAGGQPSAAFRYARLTARPAAIES